MRHAMLCIAAIRMCHFVAQNAPTNDASRLFDFVLALGEEMFTRTGRVL
jgi:hypothetical protein